MTSTFAFADSRYSDAQLAGSGCASDLLLGLRCEGLGDATAGAR